MILPYRSTVLSGATNTYVACENQLTYLTDTAVLSRVRAFVAS